MDELDTKEKIFSRQEGKQRTSNVTSHSIAVTISMYLLYFPQEQKRIRGTKQGMHPSYTCSLDRIWIHTLLLFKMWSEDQNQPHLGACQSQQVFNKRYITFIQHCSFQLFLMSILTLEAKKKCFLFKKYNYWHVTVLSPHLTFTISLSYHITL